MSLNKLDRKYLNKALRSLATLTSEMDSVYARILLRGDPRLKDNERNLRVGIKHLFGRIYKHISEMPSTGSTYKSVKKYTKNLKSMLSSKEWDPQITPELLELQNMVYHAKIDKEEG